MCSLSIFPPNIVLALPEISLILIQGISAPFEEISTDEYGEEDNNILRQYTLVRVQEMDRMKRLKGVRLKELLSRRLKDNGAKYSTNGIIDILCSILFQCNVHFLASR